MITTNIDVADGLVNGIIGILKLIEYKPKTKEIDTLWLDFERKSVGNLLRLKNNISYLHNSEIDKNWVPIRQRTAYISFKAGVSRCKRIQFPVVESCATTIHKAQGGSYKIIIYEYNGTHDQKLVYIALSRTHFQGTYLTNRNEDHNFYHAVGKKL